MLHQLLCILGVAAGGASGGLLRWGSLQVLEQMGCSEMVALLVINLTGCFLLGGQAVCSLRSHCELVR